MQAHRAAAELRSLPTRWTRALRSADLVVHERAAQLGDELHAVANRVARLLAAPGARLAPVRLQSPTAGRGAVPRELTGALMRVAADRLAGMVDGLSPSDWRIAGRMAGSPITIGELVAAPLHSSRRLLAESTPARPSPAGRERRATAGVA